MITIARAANSSLLSRSVSAILTVISNRHGPDANCTTIPRDLDPHALFEVGYETEMMPVARVTNSSLKYQRSNNYKGIRYRRNCHEILIWTRTISLISPLISQIQIQTIEMGCCSSNSHHFCLSYPTSKSGWGTSYRGMVVEFTSGPGRFFGYLR